MTTNMTTILNDLIERAYEQGADTSPAELQRVVERDYPEVYDTYSRVAASNGVKIQAGKLLRQKSHEKQEALPGMNLQRFFTVPDGEGGTVSRSLLSATLADHAADLDIKRKNVEAVTREFVEAQRRNDLLWSVPGAHEAMLVTDAANWLKDNAPQP